MIVIPSAPTNHASTRYAITGAASELFGFCHDMDKCVLPLSITIGSDDIAAGGSIEVERMNV